MKIIFLTSRFPFPLDRGDKLRAFHQIRELSKYHEVHLVSVSDSEVSETDEKALSEYCHSIEVIVIPPHQRWFNLIKAFFSNMPIQVSYFFDQSVKRQIHNLIDVLKPDHIFVQLIRMAPYIKGITFPKSIDYMDSFALNWQNESVPHFKYIPYLDHLERRRVTKYERTVFDWFEHHFVICERDRSIFPSDICDQIDISPNGIDTNVFEPLPHIDAEYDLVFCGNLGYIHNDKAANYLIDEIMSHMSADTTLLIAGARPSAWLNIKQRTNIRVLGWTDDIRVHYQKGRIFVAPIFTGSGQQNKILEAMAQGLPCITTSFVNQSIGAQADDDILIADNPKQFISQIEALIGDKNLRLQLSLRGRKFVQENFQWSDAIDPILDAIES